MPHAVREKRETEEQPLTTISLCDSQNLSVGFLRTPF